MRQIQRAPRLRQSGVQDRASRSRDGRLHTVVVLRRPEDHGRLELCDDGLAVHALLALEDSCRGLGLLCRVRVDSMAVLSEVVEDARVPVRRCRSARLGSRTWAPCMACCSGHGWAQLEGHAMATREDLRAAVVAFLVEFRSIGRDGLEESFTQLFVRAYGRVEDELHRLRVSRRAAAYLHSRRWEHPLA